MQTNNFFSFLQQQQQQQQQHKLCNINIKHCNFKQCAATLNN